MAQADTDRDLLFGVLALQNGLVDRPALVAALHAWSLDRSASVASRLRARGDLAPDGIARVEALVDRHAGEIGPAPPDASTVAAEPEATATSPHFAPKVESTVADPDPDADADPEATAVHLGSTESATATAPAWGSTEPARADRRHRGDDGFRYDGQAHASNGHAHGDDNGNGERFRILRPHAQGGLGAVFVALDDELNREVALKQILRHHVDDAQSRARFLIEAEITGGLEHPGIVPVYGLGSDHVGRPYYAMRFIKGGSLKEAIAAFHADPSFRVDRGARSLALRELLRRFVDVCNAIDYAHGRGVLHRDLKPSNIVVGKHGETLVVDWGLAKATGQQDPGAQSDEQVLIPNTSGGLAMTLEGSALGTPSYMSPEAAAGDLKSVGPRSDVYSLGATLYCLLTGQSAFDGDDLVVLLGQIKGGEFPTPRQVDPAIDPALEAICLKAMATGPPGRYDSARELANDLKRWSADEPVLAYPEGRRRRLARWVRRHASLVAATGALLVTASATLALAAGLIAAERDRVREVGAALAASNARLAEERNRSDAARIDAEAGYRVARKAVEQQFTTVAQYQLPAIPQAEKLRLRLVEQAAEFYRLFHARSPDDPETRQELARIEADVANLYRAMGRFVASRERYEAASNLLAGATQPGSIDHLAYVEGQIGELIRISGGRFDQAEPHYRRAVELASVLSGDFPKTLRYASLEARVNADLAYLLIASGRHEEAEPFALKAAERGRAYDASLPADEFANNRLVLPVALGARPMILARRGRPEAEPAARELVDLARRLAALEPGSADVQMILADALNELAKVIATDPARRAEALVLQDETVARMAPLIARHPAIVQYPARLATFRADRAVTRTALDQLDEARDDLERARPILQAEVKRVAGTDPLEVLGRATADLARVEARCNQLEAARQRFREAITWHEKAQEIDPKALLNAGLLGKARADLAALDGPP